MSAIFDFLNSNSGAIQGIAVVVLVIATIYYAVQTQRTVKEMKRQNTADIKLYKAELLRARKGWVDKFKPKTEEEAESHGSAYFKVRIIVANQGGTSGSIGKPTLIMRCKKDHMFYNADPVTTEQEFVREVKNGISIGYEEYKTIDLGKTIYLKPGQMEVVELKYYFKARKYPEKARHFIEHFNYFGYSIKYCDQSNNKFEIPLIYSIS